MFKGHGMTALPDASAVTPPLELGKASPRKHGESKGKRSPPIYDHHLHLGLDWTIDVNIVLLRRFYVCARLTNAYVILLPWLSRHPALGSILPDVGYSSSLTLPVGSTPHKRLCRLTTSHCRPYNPWCRHQPAKVMRLHWLCRLLLLLVSPGQVDKKLELFFTRIIRIYGPSHSRISISRVVRPPRVERLRCLGPSSVIYSLASEHSASDPLRRPRDDNALD